jgi:hypothetical protein
MVAASAVAGTLSAWLTFARACAKHSTCVRQLSSQEEQRDGSHSQTTSTTEHVIASASQLLLQLVQRQSKARDEGFEKVADFRQIELVNACAQHLLGVRKLGVASRPLLAALEIRTQLVGRFDQLRILWFAGLGLSRAAYSGRSGSGSMSSKRCWAAASIA